MSAEYNLTNLWPEFNRLVELDITSPEGLSALFIAAILFVAAFFTLTSLINYIKSKKHITYYKKLIDGLPAEHLSERRREITNNAMVNNKYGQLWREFDESLVLVPQKNRLCNTLDAAHFFNTHTLASGLTENRMLAAVPGFITAIGVIGTFVGLQLGLGPLGLLDPSAAGANDLTHGIFGMIGGASIAFMTSVWGVLVSVLFNFFEKLMERQIRLLITAFQNKVDYLYPRITAEQSLSNIEEFTRLSNEKLAGLDEKIGHKMQEVMDKAAGTISSSVAESLNNVLGPAIGQLVEKANSGSEKALESLLQRFLDGVGTAGEAQREMMDKAASDVAKASDSMTLGLESFTQKLGTQVEQMVDKNFQVLNSINASVQSQLEEQANKETARQEQLNSNLSQFISSLQNDIAEQTERNATTMRSVQSLLSEQIAQQQDREVSRQTVLNKQLKEFSASQQQVSESISGVLETQKSQTEQLLRELNVIVENFNALSQSHAFASEAMKNVSTEMKASSNQLGLLSANLKETVNGFSEKLIEALKYADEITKGNAVTADAFKIVGEELRQSSETVKSAAEAFDEAAITAESGLSSVNAHFRSLGESLKDHVNQLEEEIANLLSEYADRVQGQTRERMVTWNEQTNNYISAMTDAVRTLGSVVDEIDGKVSERRIGTRS